MRAAVVGVCGAIALAAGGCSTGGGGKRETTLAIRWTAAVPLRDVKELRDLNALLDRPPAGLEPGDKLTMVLADNPGHEVVVTTCRQYLAMKRRGYVFKSNYDNGIESFFKAATLPLAHLARAEPAKKSFLQRFTVAGKPLEELPASLGLRTGQAAAVRNGQRWGEAFPEAKVQVVDTDSIVVTAEGSSTQVTVLAFADFNHDGIEDVLLSVSNHATEGALKVYRYVILTRKGETQRLTVVTDES